MQSAAVSQSIKLIDPESAHFESLWHTVPDVAREKLRDAFPKCKQATDIFPKLASVPLKDLDDEIKKNEDNIKTKEDCDDVIELALLRLYGETEELGEESMQSQMLDFIKKHEYIIGGASDARLESLLCQLAVIQHPRAAPAIKKHLAEKFVIKGDGVILQDAAKKMKMIEDKIHNTNWEEMREMFRFVAANCPQNADVGELLLLFRMQLARKGALPAMTESQIPEIISRNLDIPEDFLWEFRCNYGVSVLGIAPPRPSEEDFGFTEICEDVIDISNKKSTAAVFAALYNHAWPAGYGFGEYIGLPMFEKEAEYALEKFGPQIEYYRGRCLKLLITKDSKKLNVRHYNRDNCRGIAQRAISTVPNIR